MRWIKPKLHDTRIIKKFAWFPIKIDRETRWLETCYIDQEYVEEYSNFLTMYIEKFRNVEFVTKEEYETKE